MTFLKQNILLWLLLIPATTLRAQNQPLKLQMQTPHYHYTEGDYVRIKMQLKNESNQIANFVIHPQVRKSNTSEKVWETKLKLDMPPNYQMTIPLAVPAPATAGKYIFIPDNDTLLLKNKSQQFVFQTHQPVKSNKLQKILIHVPHWEHELEHIIEDWNLKAPSISWGQVVLCSTNSWKRLQDGDKEVYDLLERALRRKMAVVFIDFGPDQLPDGETLKLSLPFNISVQFKQEFSPEKKVYFASTHPELRFTFQGDALFPFNGMNGLVVPPISMKIKGKNIDSAPIIRTGVNPYRFPVKEIATGAGRGHIILCQLRLEHRLDMHTTQKGNGTNDLFYDPIAVQLVMNLLSAVVDESLLKE